MSFLCWNIPFIIRICIIDIQYENVDKVKSELFKERNAITETMQAISEGNKHNIFVLILKNNLKGCIINIAGGVLLGLGTFINLLFNGFFSADIFVNSYKAGLGIQSIIKITLPHSFELIGFWLSGAIGFYITWNIIQFMRGKESFTIRFYKQIVFYSLIVFIIILVAAYVEAYVSITILK
jgi:uncharacterized membrane protein SpoIIM required for sporulation